MGLPSLTRFQTGILQEALLFKTSRSQRSDAVPTPDQKGLAEAAELQGLGSSLKVTIQREGDSREFGQTAGQTEGKRQGHHCHLCSSSCPTLQAFQNHMMGTEHQKRLKEVTQIVKTAGSRGDQPIRPRWCDTCQKHFTADVILHRRTNQHKEPVKGEEAEKQEYDPDTVYDAHGVRKPRQPDRRTHILTAHTLTHIPTAGGGAPASTLTQRHVWKGSINLPSSLKVSGVLVLCSQTVA
ncbi:hypothetical protein NHX12_028237 [Muraenolepis orangiensis]|uniref:CIZ1 C2H2-type zinc finger domain-containing protein n=1 Tax=Muraenolepis orangiensis TaxID=630683 RepID=A0A9Q0IK40_9TELE|nr:hypothetical protein NHX12_028237 [Muraenolepis orangiensis]